jgi:glycosyltransferase involved in cell wall biosynthesis
MAVPASPVAPLPTRYVLLGDAESPHLLKWARALAALPGLELWVASSRSFLPGFDAVLPAGRRLALATAPDAAGGNVAVLRQLPRLARWLQQVDAAVLHAHYLTSHGTLAWLAQRLYGVRGALVASAWGSDILVAPQRSAAVRWLTRRVLRASVLCTSDSQVMAEHMRALGARDPMVFPFGLEALPPAPVPGSKDDLLYFANRGLEPGYAPQRVLALFAARAPSSARLVVANEGSLLAALQAQAAAQGIGPRVQFVGRLDAATQAGWYARARWYISLPTSDSVAVSVLEAMAHGCLPLLSDLPANRELVRHGDNGWIVDDGDAPEGDFLALMPRAESIASANRQWVAEHALFGPCVQAFMARLQALAPQAFAPPAQSATDR